MSAFSLRRRALRLAVALAMLASSVLACVRFGPEALLRMMNVLFVTVVFEEASPDGVFVATAVKINVHMTTPNHAEVRIRRGRDRPVIGPDVYGIEEPRIVFGASHADSEGLKWLDERTLLVEYSGGKYLDIWRQEDSWRDVRIIYHQVE